MKAALEAALRQATALVAPPVCTGCRRAQAPADALALCPACVAALRWTGPGACRRCALPAHGGRPCPAGDAPWTTAWAPVGYAGPARALVRAVKFDGALGLLDVLAAQVATNLPVWAGPRGTPAAVVVPVPPVPARRRRRGFDAADGLAVRVAERLGLEVQRPLRRVDGGRQLGAGRARRRAPDGVDVRLVTGVTIATAPVLLVDDVHTTGATLRAAARSLRAAGIPQVHAVTYARAV